MATTIGERLRQKRIEKGFDTARAAARAYGWNEHTYRSHENGSREPPKDMLLLYASHYGVSVSWLLRGAEDSNRPRRTEGQHVPIIEWEDLPSGRPDMVAVLRKAKGGGITLSNKVGSDDVFLLPVRDNSMVSPSGDPHSLHLGDNVICDVRARPAPGKTVLVWDAEDKTNVLRKVQALGGNRLKFTPLNPDYRSFELEADSPAILAVVVQLHRHI